MFSEVELVRDVIVTGENPDNKQSERLIVERLLQELAIEKASKEHGYFLSVTSLKRIGKQNPLDENRPGYASFPVSFNCKTFLPVKGEILQGIVVRVSWHGVFLQCGPVKCAFLSIRKMPSYRPIFSRRLFFEREDHSRIGLGVVVLFKVISVRCIESWDTTREFQLLASIDRDSLGPLSFPGYYDEIDSYR